MERGNKDIYEKLLSDFIQDDIMVCCPTCSRQAWVKTENSIVENIPTKKVKAVCGHCGYYKLLGEIPSISLFSTQSKPLFSRVLAFGTAIDPYFHLPLWLVSPCVGEVFWAYNYAHLDFLRQHVSAKLRERNHPAYSNQSIGSRLPRWMTAAKHRDTVLKCMDALKRKG